MEYLSLIFIILILLTDIPFIKPKLISKYNFLNRFLGIAFVITGLFHGIISFNKNIALSGKLVSGILLFGLIAVYKMSGEHSGIEDKIARSNFKKIAFFIAWLVIFIHIYF